MTDKENESRPGGLLFVFLRNNISGTLLLKAVSDPGATLKIPEYDSGVCIVKERHYEEVY